MSLQVQFTTLVMMLACGLAMGGMFDVYRVLAAKLRIGRLWLPVLDLLYWLVATLLVFGVLTRSNQGELRVFVFIGLLLGIGFYFWLLSSMVIAFVVWLIEMIRRLLDLLLRIVELLVIKPLRLIWQLLRFVVGLLVVSIVFIGKIMLQVIRPFGLLALWLLRPLMKPLEKLLVRPLGRLLQPLWTGWLKPSGAGAIRLWGRLRTMLRKLGEHLRLFRKR